MKYIFTMILLIVFSGCSVKHITNNQTEQQSNKNIRALTKAIVHLDKSIDKEEANTLARIAYTYPKELAQEYKLVLPALWHNTLINMNLKKRGFCYHFAQDILKELKKHPIKTIDLKWVTHKKAQYWEHNAILIKAKNQSYTQGIVLDAWRNSGELYWNYLYKDKSYDWVYDPQKSNYYGN